MADKPLRQPKVRRDRQRTPGLVRRIPEGGEMMTSDFNALLRQWGDYQLDRYLDGLDDNEPPEDIEPACLDCNQRGDKCFRCGYGG